MFFGEIEPGTIPKHWVNIGSCNGLLLSGNKPLPDPMLTQIYGAIWRHRTTMDYG